MRPGDPKGWQFAVKYTIDRVVAALLLLVISPILIGARARHADLGRAGRSSSASAAWASTGSEFDMLKFRTMKHSRPEAERSTAAGTAMAMRFKPSSTPLPAAWKARTAAPASGASCASTSLDELPQLINVLRGEMSLIGPRPERPEFVELFGEDVHRYTDRHRVKSGITGWAQIHGLRGQTSISDRAEWDNYYIENWSLWLDFKIAVMTIPACSWALASSDLTLIRPRRARDRGAGRVRCWPAARPALRSRPAAISGCAVPADFSAGDQYVETLPTTKGPRAPRREQAREELRASSKDVSSSAADAAALERLATSRGLGAPDAASTTIGAVPRARDGRGRTRAGTAASGTATRPPCPQPRSTRRSGGGGRAGMAR